MEKYVKKLEELERKRLSIIKLATKERDSLLKKYKKIGNNRYKITDLFINIFFYIVDTVDSDKSKCRNKCKDLSSFIRKNSKE